MKIHNRFSLITSKQNKQKLLKYISLHYNGNVHLRLCAPLLQLGVIRPKTSASTQPNIVCSTTKFCFLFLSRKHTTLNNVTLHRPVCLLGLCQVVWQIGLVFLVLWSEFEACFPPLVLDSSPMSV